MLFLDTLKVSTIEQTAESVDARGGKGNPKLITWDYGKEITVNIEDALFSPKSMAIMLGDGTASAKTSDYIKRTVLTRVAGSSTSGYIEYFTCDVYDSTAGGAVRKKVDMTTTASNDTPQAGMINFATFINAGAAISAITYEDGTEASDATPSTGWTFADVKTAV